MSNEKRKIEQEFRFRFNQIQQEIDDRQNEALQLLRQAVIQCGGRVNLTLDKIRIRPNKWENLTVQDVEVVEGNLRIVSVTGTVISGDELNSIYVEDLLILFKQCIA